MSGASAIEREVHRLGALIAQGYFAQTLAAAGVALNEVPQNRDLLYMTAVCERFLGRIDAALATLHRFEAVHPRYGRLHQERGHCHAARGDAASAITAYARAVTLNPALTTSWAALELLLRAAGRSADGDHARAQVARLKALPPAFVAAAASLADGDGAQADPVIGAQLRAAPDELEYLRLLADVAVAVPRWEDAAALLERILDRSPVDAAARCTYARALLHLQRHADALQAADRVLASASASAAAAAAGGVQADALDPRTLRAAALAGLGRNAEALAEFRAVLAAAPEFAELHVHIGHVYKAMGRGAEAVESYRAATRTRPRYGDAYWSLANLKNYRFTGAQVQAMQAAHADPSSADVDRYHLCFALGKAFEDRGEPAAAFDWYARGNRSKSEECGYSPAAVEQVVQIQRNTWTREFLEARDGWGCQSPGPVFIVGMPRSGSTLIEQILASHSAVEGTMELGVLPRLAASSGYPHALARLTRERCEDLGGRYLEETRAYRFAAKPFFIDKLPNNFLHLGLIRLILPRAKVIDVRREALACCWSNYKQLFALGQEFSYRFDHLARHRRAYVEAMSHWDRVLPGWVARVKYEGVVDDLEATVRRLLDYCGLRFEHACLDFHRTARSVYSASAEQVRRPLNRDGIESWRAFEPWLGALRSALD